MGKAAYPTSAQVIELLTSAGVPSGTLDVATATAAGWLEVERRCGRVFLATSGTRYYSPPVGTGYLDFGADLASLTSLTYQAEGGSAETWVNHSDFWLLPQNASSDAGPYTGVQFHRRWNGPPRPELHRAIRVLGSWGYAATVPEDIWDAMRFAAALKLLPTYALDLTDGKQYTSDGTNVASYGFDPIYGCRRSWERFLTATVERYRKIGI
jgi:hypothetical protein